MSDDAGATALHRVFVYGSLRRGECNHDLWFGHGVTPVADGYIRGAELVNLGDDCGIVPVEDRTRVVVGEVYDLTPEVFRGIEGLEADAGYVRRPVEVYRRSDQDGMPAIAADAYFYPMPDRIAGRPRIASGDWLLRAGRRGA